MLSWISGLLQGLFASLLWELLLALGVGALIAWLKATKQQWAGPAIYGLFGFAIVLVIGYALTGQFPLSKTQPQTTAENVEANIKVWADDFQLGVTKHPPQPDVDFGLTITLKGSNNQVEVLKVKQNSAFLQIQSKLTLSQEHQNILAKLTQEQSAFVTEELSLELARSKIGFTIIGPPAQTEPQIQVTVLSRGVPIAGLSENTFVGYLNEMDSAIRLLRSTTTLLLDHGPLHDSVAKLHPIVAQ